MKRRRFRFSFSLAWVMLVITTGAFLNVYLALRPAALEARFKAELAGLLKGPFEFSSFQLSLSRGAEIRDFRVFLPEASAEDPPAKVGLPSAGAEFLTARSVRLSPDLRGLLRGRFDLKQVVVESPVLRIARRSDGRWNWSDLFQTEGFQLSALPAVCVEGGHLAYIDEFSFREPLSEVAEDIYARVGKDPSGAISFNAQLRLSLVRKLEVKGTVTLSGAAPVVHLQVEAKKIDLAKVPARLFPDVIAEEARLLRLEGFIDLEGGLKYDKEEGLLPLNVGGKIVRCEFLPPFSPFPVTGLKGSFFLKERTLEMRDLEGTVGGGKVAAMAKVEFGGPWLFASSPPAALWWTLKGEVNSFPVDHRLLDSFPPRLKKAFEEYQPRGKAGLDLRILDSRHFPPLPEEISATVRLEGFDLRYAGFPYPVEDLKGEVLIEKGWLKFKQPIEGRNGPISVKISGPGLELRPQGEVDLSIKVESVPLDEKFRNALPPDSQETWDSFQLLGSADGVITVFRESLSGAEKGLVSPELAKPRVSVTAYPRGVRMSYRQFPYEVSGITGSIHYDSQVKRLTFEGLKGQHGEQVITGEGVVETGTSSRFDISLRSDSLQVDEDLVTGLSASGQRLLKDFDFQGRVKADVKIESTGSRPLQVRTDVTLLEGSVRPKPFPFPLKLAGGHLTLTGDHTVDFKGISTPKDSMPHVVLSGSLTKRTTERMLVFLVDLEGLKFEGDLVQALPPELENFVKSMKLGGIYEGRLEGSYTFDETKPERYSIIYRGMGISAREAAVDFGLRIHDMEATGAFIGDKSSDRPHHLKGNVHVESGWFNRVHLTKGDVTFALGEEHAAIGLARAGKKLDGMEYSIPPEMVRRLAGDKARDAFQMLVHSPDVYGGTVDGFLFVDSGDLHDLGGDFIGKGLKVARAAEDVFGAKAAGTAGEARGKVSFGGKSGDSRSLKGKGEGFIENAKLVELPLFLGILSTLFGEDSSRHYFHEVLMRFEIADGKFKADKRGGIEIRSAGLKLEGGGTLDFEGKLDLTFQPHLLDFKIPLVEQILSLVKKGLAQIWVTGDLSRPKVDFVTGGGILRFGIESSGKEDAKPPLPTDIRKGADPKEAPPQPAK